MPFKLSAYWSRLLIAGAVGLALIGVTLALSLGIRDNDNERLGAQIALAVWAVVLIFAVYEGSKRLVGAANADQPGLRAGCITLALVLASISAPQVAVTLFKLLAMPVLALVPSGLMFEPSDGASTSSLIVSPDGFDWARFVGVYVIALLVSRAVLTSRAEYTGASSNNTILKYPEWIAFGVYAVLLSTAAYLSIGSLLYVRTEPQEADLFKLQQTLNETSERVTEEAPGLTGLDTAKLESDIRAFPQALRLRLSPSLDRVRVYAAKAYRSPLSLSQAQLAWRAEAIKQGAIFFRQSTPAQFENYSAYLNATFASEIQRRRVSLRPCLESLLVVQTAVTPLVGADDAAIDDAALEPVRSALNEADSACRDAFPEAMYGPVPDATVMRGGARQPFPGPLYIWLADGSDATILIAGLVGFGLFGATIRMMGRPDKEVEDGTPRVNTIVKHTPMLDATGKPLLDGNGQPRVKHHFSDASTRVIVHGLGAAFAAFVAGKAGVEVISASETPNPYGLLLISFVGAVFAEDIWSRMSGWLRGSNGARPPATNPSRATLPPPPPPPAPAPPPAPPPGSEGSG